jgi:hypothetical protein
MKLKPQDNKVIETIFNMFVSRNNYKDLSEEDIEIVKNSGDVEGFSMLKFDMYEVENETEREVIEFVVNLSNFHGEFRKALDDSEITFDTNVQSVRLASPPYEAYKYVGFSELDINPVPMYHLLFDKE